MMVAVAFLLYAFENSRFASEGYLLELFLINKELEGAVYGGKAYVDAFFIKAFPHAFCGVVPTAFAYFIENELPLFCPSKIGIFQ
jgi:hypothetical protein